jgi:hypothetical protein
MGFRTAQALLGLSLAGCSSSIIENDEYPFTEPLLATLSAADLGKAGDPTFVRAAEDLSFPVLERRPPFAYRIWKQKTPAPLIVLLTGHGSTKESRHSTFLGQILFHRGYSVVSLPSTTHRDFILAASKGGLPGHPPDDIADLREVLVLLLKDLEIRFPKQTTGRGLVGISLGAAQALWLSQEAELGFDLYLGINPPLDMLHAQQALDACYDVPLSWPEDRRTERSQRVLRQVEAIKNGYKVGPEVVDAFGEDERRLVIGLEFRQSLVDMVLSVRRLHPELARGLPPEEIARRYSYRSYTDTVTLRSLRARGEAFTWEAWNEATSLRPRIKEIGAHPKALLFHNLDDFLIEPEMALEAKKAFGERAWIYRYGSHTGTLSTPRFMRQFLAAVEARLPTSAPLH